MGKFTLYRRDYHGDMKKMTTCESSYRNGAAGKQKMKNIFCIERGFSMATFWKVKALTVIFCVNFLGACSDINWVYETGQQNLHTPIKKYTVWQCLLRHIAFTVHTTVKSYFGQ
jgi:hypothetical protein